MKPVMFFYVKGCPYCRQAREVIQDLMKEHPQYGKVNFDEIDEDVNSDLAIKYDYYYTPAMFIGNEKIYEAHPGEEQAECREHVEMVLKRALES